MPVRPVNTYRIKCEDCETTIDVVGKDTTEAMHKAEQNGWYFRVPGWWPNKDTFAKTDGPKEQSWCMHHTSLLFIKENGNNTTVSGWPGLDDPATQPPPGGFHKGERIDKVQYDEAIALRTKAQQGDLAAGVKLIKDNDL
jgi:hypothetical protein